jgi:hypothetical protein
VELLGPPTLARSELLLPPASAAPINTKLFESSTASTTPAASCDPVIQAPAPQATASSAENLGAQPYPGSAELEKLTKGLQMLAEETSLLRQGMDKLLARTVMATCGQADVPLGRQPSPRCEVDAEAEGSRMATGHGFQRSGRQTLLIQEQLLDAVEILLSEVLDDRLGGFTPTGKGAICKRNCKADPARKVRAAATAAGAAVRAAAAAHADMLELAYRSKGQGTSGKLKQARQTHFDPVATKIVNFDGGRSNCTNYSPDCGADSSSKTSWQPSYESCAKHSEDGVKGRAWTRQDSEAGRQRGDHDLKTGNMSGRKESAMNGSDRLRTLARSDDCVIGAGEVGRFSGAGDGIYTRAGNTPIPLQILSSKPRNLLGISGPDSDSGRKLYLIQNRSSLPVQSCSTDGRHHPPCEPILGNQAADSDSNEGGKNGRTSRACRDQPRDVLASSAHNKQPLCSTNYGSYASPDDSSMVGIEPLPVYSPTFFIGTPQGLGHWRDLA